MVLFWRLLLAHLVADFPLQTDAVFAVKKETRWGVILHGTLFGLVAVLLARPFLAVRATWLCLIALWVFHTAVDRSKLILVGRGRADHVVYFLLDQMLHAGSIGLASFFLNRIPQVAVISQESVADVSLVQVGIAYVASVWLSPVISYYAHQAVSPEKVSFKFYQPPLWRMIGYIERGMLTASAAWGGYIFFLIPLVFLPRLVLSLHLKERQFSLWELFLGSGMALLAGVWIRTLQ